MQLQYIHAHRALMTHCPLKEEFLGNRKSPLVAHHYVGTWDQWTFRDDPRSWTRKKVGKYQAMAGEEDGVILHQEMAATMWLEGFVQLHGVEKAKRLLEGVGYVPPKSNNQSALLLQQLEQDHK